VVICLELGADCLHMVWLMPQHLKTQSSLASSKSRRPLNGVVVLVVVVC